MKIAIEGDGAFGSFLRKELPSVGFEIVDEDGYHPIILAVPFSAYEKVAMCNSGSHLINVCSVQKPSTEILLRWTEKVTSIHPLFGPRTPIDKRNSFLTHTCASPFDLDHSEIKFLEKFKDFSGIIEGIDPAQHDRIMARTHVVAVRMAKIAKVFTDGAADLPDEFVPNSFRLLREFVKTLEDMPVGTMESIMANPYQ